MSEPTPTKPDRRRRVLAWLSAWAVLTAVATVLHWAAWIAPRHQPPIETFLSEGFFRYAANMFGVLCSPGWFVMVRLFATGASPLHPESIVTAVIINGLSWAVWLAMLAMALRIRRWLAGTRAPVQSPAAPGNGGRRRLLVNSVFAGGALAAGGSLAHGTLVAPWQLRVTRYRVPIKGLAPELDGVRIAFICDTHLGPRVPDSFVAEALRTACDLKPDLFLLGGDYVHNGAAQLPRAAEQLKLLVATGKPVIGVLGNHDWYAQRQGPAPVLREAGITMIDNGRVFLHPGRTVSARPPEGAGLCIAGVGDLWTDVVNCAAALDGVRPDLPRLLLSHNPDVAAGVDLPPGAIGVGDRRVDLFLCGHTHGGQVVLPLIGTPIVPIRSGQRFAYGLVQGPHGPVIISSGVGMSLVPIRINCPPEIVEITLGAA